MLAFCCMNCAGFCFFNSLLTGSLMPALLLLGCPYRICSATHPKQSELNAPGFETEFAMSISPAVLIITDWWFGTFFIFPYIGNVIIPTDFHSIIFQRGRSTTNQIIHLHNFAQRCLERWDWSISGRTKNFGGNEFPLLNRKSTDGPDMNESSLPSTKTGTPKWQTRWSMFIISWYFVLGCPSYSNENPNKKLYIKNDFKFDYTNPLLNLYNILPKTGFLSRPLKFQWTP